MPTPERLRRSSSRFGRLSFSKCLLIGSDRQRHTDSVANRELQGWHPDPFGLHEMRYFSVGNPTKLVRDGRAEAYDEPPDERTAPTAAAVGSPVGGVEPATRDEIPWRGPDLDGTPRVVAADAGFGRSAEPRGLAATADAYTSVLTADTAADTALQLDHQAVNPGGERRRRRGEYAAVALGAVVAVVVFVVLAGGSRSPGLAPAAFVTKAAQRTLSQSTADVTMSGTMRMDGASLAIGGRGQVDFSTNDMSINVGASSSTGSITETELLVGGNFYLEVSVNGHDAALPGGRHWIEIPFALSAARTVTNGSPASALSLLSQEGAHVTPLGPRSINGQTCNGYTVTPTRQAMLAAVKQEGPNLGLSSSETTAELQALHDTTPPTITAWFGAQRELACQVTIDMQMGAPTSAGSGSAQMVMTFTHYGVPVKVTAPASADTVSVRQMLTASQH